MRNPMQRGPWSVQDWPFVTALVLGVIAWVLAWYWDTARAIVAIWMRSDTFAHGFIIVPISAWIIWIERRSIAALNPRPNMLALPLLAMAGFGWLLGQLAGAGVVQQFGLVVMIQAAVWAILGTRVVRALAFPLFFLLFAVPFGEFLEPMLMDHTADFTAFAIKLSGVPLYREGRLLMLPSGNWSIVEACSGLRYLIASVTVGFLYAYLTYRSFKRRTIFIVLSVIVPIVANWLRAYMIVMIGHLSSMKYAVGFDHLIYGWLFFGVVMMILFWIGSFWREDLAPSAAAAGTVAAAHAGESSLRASMATAIAVAAIVAVWPLVVARLAVTAPYRPPMLQAPLSAGNWHPATEQIAGWAPHFRNPRLEITQTYAKDAAQAGLYIGYYRNQEQESQLVTYHNTLVSSRGSDWVSAAETHRNLVVNGQAISLREVQLRGASTRLLVWYWYWVDGQYTVNPYWAKLLQAKSALLGRGDDGAVVVVYTDLGANRAEAAGRLQEFTNAMLPGITGSLDHAR